jgi:hypothetical protein
LALLRVSERGVVEILVEERANGHMEEDARICELEAALAASEEQCVALLKQNSCLFEELTETKRNYAMVAEMYDNAIAKTGEAERAMKKTRAERNEVQEMHVLGVYPALSEAAQWLRDHADPLPLSQRLEIPVLCL